MSDDDNGNFRNHTAPTFGGGGHLFPTVPQLPQVRQQLPSRRVMLPTYNGGKGFSAFDSSTFVKVGALRGAAAIAIAADSEVAAVDVYPDGNTDPRNRIRVSQHRPAIGPFPFDDAVIVPVIPVPDLSSYTTIPLNGFSNTRSMADLVYGAIDVHYNESIVTMTSGSRAPGCWCWGGGGTLANNQTIYYLVPCAGRSKVMISIYCPDDPAPTGTALYFAGVNVGVKNAGPVAVVDAYTTSQNLSSAGELSEVFNTAPWQTAILVKLVNGPASVGSAPYITAATFD